MTEKYPPAGAQTSDEERTLCVVCHGRKDLQDRLQVCNIPALKPEANNRGGRKTVHVVFKHLSRSLLYRKDHVSQLMLGYFN
jgi:hypothetical protein